MDKQYPESELTGRIIGVAIQVHKKLGPGFVEKVYQRSLARALGKAGFDFEREKKINVAYEGGNVGFQVLDFVVGGRVLVELKAVGEINKAHVGQMISYLKASSKKVGLILNFGSGVLGIKRVVL